MNDETPDAAHFDPSLGAWVVSRHADVAAALRDARLSAGGANVAGGDAAHAFVREATARALSSDRLAAWHGTLTSSAERAADALPVDAPVDLVSAFAVPWSLAVAAMVTGIAPRHAERLAPLARALFVVAASATDDTVPARATAAAAALARGLHDGADGPDAWPDVQAFVALSQTLPSALAGAWAALFSHTLAVRRLRAEPGLMPLALEELLRHAGPSRATFRRAAADVTIGEAHVAAGERVILRLAAANHDAARWESPHRLDLGRDAGGHVAFGRGRHGCPGAPLIRLAMDVATRALLSTATEVELLDGAAWIGGFAIRAPASLPVVLRRDVREE